MTPRTLHLWRPAIAALAAALVASTALVAGTAAPAAAADPRAGAPAVGSCFDATAEQGDRPVLAETPVDCAATHTMRVTAVRQLPARLTWNSPRREIFAVAGNTCERVNVKVIGGTATRRYLTLYSTFYFVPSTAQRDAGARWFSCMIGLSTSDGLAPLPQGELPRATRRPADSVAWCLDRRLNHVRCAQPHRWRAVHAFLTRAKGNDSALARAARTAADRTCSRKVASPRFVYYWHRWTPTKLMVACFTRTTS